MTDMILGFPSRYIQGPGAIHRVGEVAAKLGRNALVMADTIVRDLAWPQVEQSLTEASITSRFEPFGGECCRSEIDRLAGIGRAERADLIIAIGGGKALDAGKAVAQACDAEMIAIATVASTDAPVSSLAVEYSEDHVQVGVIWFKAGPAAVIVDSQIVAGAPARLLSAGMGDGLATWYEARACAASGASNLHGGSASPVALNLARLCRDMIIEHGIAAYDDVSQNRVSEAVERVIEANTFLSGVGFENNGVAGAHALDGAISRFGGSQSSQHGERVAVGILLQLTLEGEREELALLHDFYRKVKLPRSLTDLGLPDLSDDDIHGLAQLTLREGSPIYNLPFELSVESVAEALKSLR